MGCQADQCNKIFTPEGIFIVTSSLAGWPIKTKEASSPHEVRLTLLVTNPVFQNIREKVLEIMPVILSNFLLVVLNYIGIRKNQI